MSTGSHTRDSSRPAEPQSDRPVEPEPRGAEGVPLDAPDNTAPAIAPEAVSRMHRAEDDAIAFRRSPEFNDERTRAIDDRRRQDSWLPPPSSPPHEPLPRESPPDRDDRDATQHDDGRRD